MYKKAFILVKPFCFQLQIEMPKIKGEKRWLTHRNKQGTILPYIVFTNTGPYFRRVAMIIFNMVY